MTSAVQARGEKVNWVFLRLFVLKYISDYRYLTVGEKGLEKRGQELFAGTALRVPFFFRQS